MAMKRLSAALLVAIAVLPVTGHAQVSPEAEVDAALQRYADLLRAMDDHAIAQSFTSDGEVVNPGQTPVVGPAAIERFIRQFDGYHVLEYEIRAERTAVTGQTAVQNGRFRQKVRTPEGRTLDVNGLFQAEWIRETDGWKIRRMSTSREEAPVTGHATGTFDVKLTPTADEAAKPFSRMSVAKQFHGDLEGTSTGVMLTAPTGVKDSAGYVAFESVSGTIAGRRGTFVLQHSGLMNRGKGDLTITIVPDSGTDGLAGISGTMTITITNGVHHYDLSYAIAPKGAP
jgi:ketosteroid isomerase-like protein